MLRKYKRTIALGLLFAFLVNVFTPTISYALTAGPTAPEATSFEPVDTTDMVNLATGDLAYNIPLLEVPGPSGGYPLSLSYHAGIQPNEDASWVGLGWTLNPGAITRNVNGYADDFNSIQNSTRLFWEGGESKTFSAGVSIGLPGAASVSAGLTFSQDTYQGTGIGFSVGGGIGIGGDSSPFGVGASVGVSPYGDPYASAGLSLGFPTGDDGLGISTSLGISTNFKSVDGYAAAGVSYSHSKGGESTNEPNTTTKESGGSASLLGASISTGNRSGSVSLSVAGVSHFSNNRSGIVSTSSSGGSITIPIPVWYGVFVSLGYKHQRYWIDQTDFVNVNGSLFFNKTDLNKEWLDKNAYDTYSLPDPTVEGGVAKNPDTEKVLGGSFPSFDNYYVHAQGVGGSMRPHYFQKHLVSRNNYEVKEDSDGDEYNYYKTISYQTGFDTKGAEFRFIGDFSNRFEYTPEELRKYPDAGHDPSVNPLTYDFGWAVEPVIGENGNDAYNSNRLAGSRHVEWLTNAEIPNSVKAQNVGFIETKSTGLNRSALHPDGIGAFVVTNESGVKYHFALPVMTGDEYSYSENISKTLTFNEFKNPQSYAYTWYLTAVTGPDYVDRGPNGSADGILNEYDWGYWVEFEYGKWTDQYYWRNPSEGSNVDLDKNFKNFSEGRKELYYLDAIRTKTHTAFFVKDIRHDAKSVVYSYRDISGRFKEKRNKETITSTTKNGGFIPSNVTNTCERNYTLLPVDEGSISYVSRPTSTLKLEKIFLVKNEDVNALSMVKANGSEYAQQYTYNWNIIRDGNLPSNCYECQDCDFNPLVFNQHLYQNVLDVHDIQNVAIESKSLRVIDLNTDYSLSPNTSNSFDFNLVKGATPSNDNDDYPKFGKLTLTSINFRGKEGADMMPPMEFSYDLENPSRGYVFLTISGGKYSFRHTNSRLIEGDLIVWGNEEKYYGVVTRINESVHEVKIVGSNYPDSSGYISWTTTKNPPYDKDLYDAWGLYKSDLNKSLLNENEDAARLVSQVSARSLDVWSLRNVKTSLGAQVAIDYEPDKYRKPVLTKNQILRIANIESVNSWRYRLTIYDDIPDLDKILKPGSNVNYSFLFGDPVRLDLPFETKKEFVERIEEGLLPIVTISKGINDKWVIETNLPSTYFEPRPSDDVVHYHPPLLLSGNLSHSQDFENHGGGIRIKEISTSNLQQVHKTSYHYNLINDLRASGVTSYEPGGLDQAYFYFPNEGESLFDYFDDADKVKEAKELYQEKLNRNFFDLLTLAREIPPPGVLYENVTVRGKIIRGNETIENPNYSTYHFEVFNRGMVGMVYSSTETNQFSEGLRTQDMPLFSGYDRIKTRSVALKNYSARIGNLKSVTLYDKSGNKVSETINNYLHDAITPELLTDNDPAIEDNFEANIKHYEPSLADRFSNQGVVEETFAEARLVRQDYDVVLSGTFLNVDAFNLLGIVSKREEFPSIQIGQTTLNYKSGIKTKTENLAFDFYSGQVTKTLSTDGYGNSFITELTPAYRKYPAMGLLANGGKNMLAQEAASVSYKVDSQNNPVSLVSAGVQTWSDQVVVEDEGTQPGIWRKHASYSFIGDDNVSLGADGLYPYSNFEPFNFSGTSSTKWQKNGEITLYDVHSHALEASDINGNFAATKMSLDQTQVLATVANANYDEFAFAGVEDAVVNGVGGGVVTNGSIINTGGHTGKKAVEGGNGVKSFSYTFDPKQRTYHVSVWSSQSQCAIKYSLDSGSPQSAQTTLRGQAGSWYLLEADIPLTSNASALEIWCEATAGLTIFDDFRVHPLDAAMTSYVYNQWGELTHILDNNNLYTEFKYDGMGRLTETVKETFQHGAKTTSRVIYHYANQN